MSLVIEIEDVKKNYNDIEALKGIDLEVEKGEVIVLLGPNGAGKSTLMNIMTGQITRTGGKVEVLGIDPEKENKKLKTKLGVLPEREDPPSFLTGNEYLKFIQDIRKADLDDKWVKKLNLEGKIDTLTYEMSKGERQKLMLIQAFFHEPELIFIDEPLINLDPLIQEEAKTIFKEAKDNEATLVISTHLISLAKEVCDRVIFLKDGKIIEDTENVENLKQKFLDAE